MLKKNRMWSVMLTMLGPAALLFAVPAVLPQASLAQAGSQTFPETGQTVSGRFLDYWNLNGGLAQQGFPISPEMQEGSVIDGKIYTVQYFERAEFELHPENAAPNDVLLSLLGTLTYKLKYPNGATELPAPANPIAGMSFPQTGKEIHGEFLTYWQTHGGLQQQGYPITNLMLEKSDLDGKQYTVQYFERAVFEMHPENAPPYNILLSQLGTLRFKQRYSLYGHAQDYSWVTGQLKQQGACWVVTYVSPLVDIAADRYNNQFALVPGNGWTASAVKDGEWVVVSGKPEEGTAPATGCTAHGYAVSALIANPNTGGSATGHAHFALDMRLFHFDITRTTNTQ